MKSKHLSHRMWAKALAYFLLAAFACGLMGSVLGAAAAWSFGVYDTDLSRVKENHIRPQVISSGANIVFLVAKNAIESAETLAGEKNVEYAVSDHTGSELWRSAGFGAQEDVQYAYSLVYRMMELDGGEWAEYMGLYHNTPAELEDADYVLRAEIGELSHTDVYYWTVRGLDLVYALRYAVYFIGALCLIGAVACFVFLMCGAGHRIGREGLTPGYLYKIPFDVMTAALVVYLVGIAVLFREWTRDEWTRGYPGLIIFLLIIAVPAVLVPFTGWCASLAARIKLGAWWRNTVIYRILHLLWRILCWLFRALRTVVRSMPLIWKTALVLFVLSVLELIFLANVTSSIRLLPFWLIEKLLLIPAVLYLAIVLRRLQKGGAALAAGDLDYKTDTKHMVLDLKQHGENLNSIAGGMTRAVEQQLKSEHLKTELITNVSHDIKTPLTSIINYVDLLKRGDAPEKQAEYLEVLDRQSRKLKKLTEDLVEVSKASTGNVEVNASRHSVSELLRQAVGEYEDRLQAAGLEPVLTVPEQELFARLDGALMWRVLDNLLGNACKYAQSGTRLYISAELDGGSVRMSFKNISREMLNIPAQELMERFVRGDSARTGEGSGLGLSIARSLTELQGGTFTLTVDGDLFKADLTFPAEA